MAPSVMTYSSGATCRLSLSPDLAAVHDTVKTACHFLSEQRVGEQDLVACELALVEACNNAVTYSNPKPGQTTASDNTDRKPAALELCCDSNWIELQVIDHGPGF